MLRQLGWTFADLNYSSVNAKFSWGRVVERWMAGIPAYKKLCLVSVQVPH